MGDKIKIMWITNMMPGFVASRLGMTGTNKEGWIEGAARKLLQDENISLAIAFPYSTNGLVNKNTSEELLCYGFLEDTNHPEKYDDRLEKYIGDILAEYEPDVIHLFGTEFPHARALMSIDKWSDKVLIHIQGIIEECEKVYAGGVPDKVIKRKTFRDFIKKDSIEDQIEKYRLRGINEHIALENAKHVLGRTAFDMNHVKKINSSCKYHRVNETLRESFYNNKWNKDNCNKHEIFLSQGNYPLKGAHTAIEAINILAGKYEDIKLYIAGDKITSYDSLKSRIKISSYGKYLLELIKKYNLADKVVFTGSLTESEMLERYLKAEVFILTSFLENSPNSLGEAMLLGMPTVASFVGGVPSLAENGEESLLYKAGNAAELASMIDKIFTNETVKISISEKARQRALVTHDAEANFEELYDIYKRVSRG